MNDPIVISTIIIAAATVANVLISAFLWWATKRSADIANAALDSMNRPFLHVTENIGGSNGERSMEMITSIANYSDFPANKVVVQWTVWSNDKVVYETSEGPFVSVPQNPREIRCVLEGAYWIFVTTGKTTLKVAIDVNYEGVTKKPHRYRMEYRSLASGTPQLLSTEAD